MKTSILHFSTAYLPLVASMPAFFILAINPLRYRTGLTKTAWVLLILNAVLTTFTSAMGGASISVLKSIPAIDQGVLTIHAWTGMLAFLLSLLMAYLAIRILKREKEGKHNLILVLLLLFMFSFIFTVAVAYGILS